MHVPFSLLHVSPFKQCPHVELQVLPYSPSLHTTIENVLYYKKVHICYLNDKQRFQSLYDI